MAAAKHTSYRMAWYPSARQLRLIAAHPDLLGIGIDESTAIVVHGNEFEVIGESKVGIYDGKEHEGKRYYFLSHGQKFDLKKRAVK